MENNSVSPISGELLAPIAEFDKSPPTPPEEVPMDDLPPPPISVPDTCCKSYQDEEETRWSKCKMCEYVFVLVLTIVLIFGSFGLLLFWIMKFRQGVLWERQNDTDKNEQYMNLHYIFMTSGFITCGSLSMMLYRILRCCPKLLVKLIHMLLHCLTGCLVAFGLKVTWDYHSGHDPPYHFHSLHSWIGITAVGLFVLQFLVGFVSFIILALVKRTEQCREVLSHIHAAFGVVILVLAVCASCTALHRINTIEDFYLEWSEEAIMVNVIGILFVAIAIVVSYAVRRPSSKYEAKVFVTERL